MNLQENFKKLENESFEDYCYRISMIKDDYGLTWNDVADIINTNTGHTYSSDKYRKQSYKYGQSLSDDSSLEYSDLERIKIERVKAADERRQANAVYRRLAREETIRDIAAEVVNSISDKIKLPPLKPFTGDTVASGIEAILQVSDWHFGIEINNPYNKYNPDIARERVAKLRDEVIAELKKRKIPTLHIVNLGDLIAGRIHLELRINSQFDVITQIIQVSELLAEFIYDIASQCRFCDIHYYSTMDNHSRLEPNKKESLELETLARITDWYLKERFSKIDLPITMHENTFGDDIVTFKSLMHNIIAVHGDKDKPAEVVEKLSLMTRQSYDLCLTAHLHHFSADERNKTVVVSNSSLMGTDAFAERLRLSATPSQNLIIVTPDCACSEIKRICF